MFVSSSMVWLGMMWPRQYEKVSGRRRRRWEYFLSAIEKLKFIISCIVSFINKFYPFHFILNMYFEEIWFSYLFALWTSCIVSVSSSSRVSIVTNMYEMSWKWKQFWALFSGEFHWRWCIMLYFNHTQQQQHFFFNWSAHHVFHKIFNVLSGEYLLINIGKMKSYHKSYQCAFTSITRIHWLTYPLIHLCTR